MLFHRHRYVEEQRVFAPPVPALQATRISPETVQRLALGLTTIIDRCRCGRVRITEIFGDARIK